MKNKTLSYLELMTFLGSIKGEDGFIRDLFFVENIVFDIPQGIEIFEYNRWPYKLFNIPDRFFGFKTNNVHVISNVFKFKQS